MRKAALIQRGSLLYCLCACTCSGQVAGIKLTKEASVVLRKSAGNIEELAPMAGGGFVLCASEPATGVELYQADGAFTRKLGRFGLGKGEYRSPVALLPLRDGSVWVADLERRLIRFDGSGTVVQTQWVRKPSYILSLAADERRDLLVLTGWFFPALEGGKNDGLIQILHEYRMSDFSLRRSILDRDPEAQQKNLMIIERVFADVHAGGWIFAANAPIRKLWRIDLEDGSVHTFPIQSPRLKPFPTLDPVAKPDANMVFRSNYMIDRVVATDAHVLVSVRKPDDGGHLLEIFTPDGKQIAADIEAPGQLVSRSGDGRLYFTRRVRSGFEVGGYRVAGGVVGPPRRAGTRK